jgi:diguanylate cyclase (GGDEF)-like protein
MIRSVYAWKPRGLDSLGMDHEAEYLRRAAMSSFRILRSSQEPDLLWPRLVEEVSQWLEASAVQAFRFDRDGLPDLVAATGTDPVPQAAFEMEQALMLRAIADGRSLISNHPGLAPELCDLGARLATNDSVVHVLLLRAHQETHAALGVHWLGVARPGYEKRSSFYSYLENAAMAVAMVEERARREHELNALYSTAYFDALTGLPNQRSLDRQLDHHAATFPLGILVLDFDGMRAANAAFHNDYAKGGDVLIRAVASELERSIGPGEFAARMHTAGDEFCVLLPGADDQTARQRASDLETILDGLEVPHTHTHVYRGASVGAATRLPDETPGQTLGRASVKMHERKRNRSSAA